MFKNKKREFHQDPPIYDVRDIAYTLINEAITMGKPLNNIKTMVLLYYVQALAISRLKRIVFEDEFVAWPNGPAIDVVWDELNKFSFREIDEPVIERKVIEFHCDRVTFIKAEVVTIPINREMIDEEILQVIQDVIIKVQDSNTIHLIKYFSSEILWRKVKNKETIKMEDMIEYFLNTSEEKILNIAPKKLDNQL